jgi:transposase
VEAVLGTIRKLQLDALLGAKRSRERDLVVAMIAERILFPASKLATTRSWLGTTLAGELALSDADENELYAALDWLLSRKDAIEKKLAARHLAEGSLVLYDSSSSFYYGHARPLARFGKDRDGKGLPIIVYGVVTDAEGRPIAVDIYPGNTGDPTTVSDQAEKLRKAFGLTRVVLAGDRGMLTQTQLDKLEQYPGLGWISALRSTAIRQLMERGILQRSLFDQQNLAEISSPDFPGERLVACYNPLLAEERQRTRHELLEATEKKPEKLSKAVKRGTKTPLSASEIGVKAGRLINHFKMAKHFELKISDGAFACSRKLDAIRLEEQLDGLYVIRTSEPKDRFSAAQTVRGYKSLAQVERAFRCMKGVDLMVRPIFLRTEDHVRAHILLCLLAYYVEWHMRLALAPLLFADEEIGENRKTRDPVAPAQPSGSAVKKRASHKTPEDLPVHSFKTLLQAMSTRCKNTCRLKAVSDSTFTQITDPSPLQARVFELLKL